MWVKLGEGKVYTRMRMVYLGEIWIHSEPELVKVINDAHTTQVLPMRVVDRIALLNDEMQVEVDADA